MREVTTMIDRRDVIKALAVAGTAAWLPPDITRAFAAPGNAALTAAQPSAADLEAAPLIEECRWATTDTGLYAWGRVERYDCIVGEVIESDTGRRWVRDKDGKLWRLGWVPA